MESAALSGGAGAAAAPVRARRVACLPPPLRTNPYQPLLYAALADQGYELDRSLRLKLFSLVRHRSRVSVLHLHWIESYYRHAGGPRIAQRPLCWLKLALFSFRLFAATALRYRIVWTAHQVLPHESTSPRLDLAASRAVARSAQAIIVHDAATRGKVEAILGSRAARKATIIPHGTFANAYVPGRPRSDVRIDLGIGPDTFVFLAFGHVRAYKDLDLLLEGFRAARVG